MDGFVILDAVVKEIIKSGRYYRLELNNNKANVFVL